MLFDIQSNQVRLTKKELNRIRKHAVKKGHAIHSIATTEELDDALVKACSAEEMSYLLDKIQIHIGKYLNHQKS